MIQAIAQQKANALQNDLDSTELLICADTIVYLANEVIGKPTDEKDAIRLLNKLSGKKHEVYTGVVLSLNGVSTSFSVKTSVYFRTLTANEIAHYVTNYEPFDKAGSYGIQEWIGLVGITKIEGSYTNVVGLPVEKVYKKLIHYAENY